MHRLFAGFGLPPDIRARLLALMGGVPGARWQDDEQLHLTLRYIGEVERPLAEDVALALGQVDFTAVEIALAGVGAFDRKARVNALWAGVTPHEALGQLHRKIDQALVRLGQQPEHRAYHPHITLARLSAPLPAAEPFLAAQAGLTSAPFVLDRFTLFESHLGHAGARYEAIAYYPLRQPSAAGVGIP